jgi:hypothetical protein
MGVGSGRPAPGHVIVEGQTLVAVGSSRVVLADAHAPLRSVRTRRVFALGRVPVALAPANSHFKLRRVSISKLRNI